MLKIPTGEESFAFVVFYGRGPFHIQIYKPTDRVLVDADKEKICLSGRKDKTHFGETFSQFARQISICKTDFTTIRLNSKSSAHKILNAVKENDNDENVVCENNNDQDEGKEGEDNNYLEGTEDEDDDDIDDLEEENENAISGRGKQGP